MCTCVWLCDIVRTGQKDPDSQDLRDICVGL